MAGQYDPSGASATVALSPAGSLPDFINSAVQNARGMFSGNAIDQAFPGISHNPDGSPLAYPFGATIGGAIDTATNAAKGTGALLDIVTDLPRLGTILVGGLLITAGLFSLASGNKIIQAIRP